REVERADNSPDTVRAQHTLTVLARDNSIHRPNVAMILLHDPSIVPEHICSLVDLGDRLVPVLADLVGYQRRQVELAFLNYLRGLPHQRNSLSPSSAAPCLQVL